MMFSNYVEAYDLAEKLSKKSTSLSFSPPSDKTKNKVGSRSKSHFGPLGGDLASLGEISHTETTTSSDSSGLVKETRDTSSPLSSPSSSLKACKKHAKELLKHIRSKMIELEAQEKDLDHAVSVHLDRAKARMVSQNKAGAILSMKKFQKLQGERQLVAKAMDFLETQEMTLVAYVRKIQLAKQQQARNGGADDASASVYSLNDLHSTAGSLSSSSKLMALEWELFENASEQVNKILAAEDKQDDYDNITLSDQDLLNELIASL